MAERDVRQAKKAGSWYNADQISLSQELERNLNGVSAAAIGVTALPIPGARAIIAPHAGYEYSGECAAWAYRCLDLSQAKKIFLLGPSHMAYVASYAVTDFSQFQTPFGTLEVDRPTLDELRSRDQRLGLMPRRDDEKEHSLELQLPYLYKRLEQTFGAPSQFPTLVPIIVGNLNEEGEARLGRLLAPYLRDPANAFVISSDFCHWGGNFDYSPYSSSGSVGDLRQLRAVDRIRPGDRSVETSIELVDHHAMDAIVSGSHTRFAASLRLSRNTVCGRHPIGVMMAAMEAAAAADGVDPTPGGRYRFTAVRYTTSARVKRDPPIVDSSGHSVSYVSAYAVL